VPTPAENAETALNNLLTVLATKTAEWVAAGMPPTFSLDGLSVNWVGWLRDMNAAIEAQAKLVAMLQGPFVRHSRARA
jgi:hypothetical protein